jgi:hypothetical protein
VDATVNTYDTRRDLLEGVELVFAKASESIRICMKSVACANASHRGLVGLFPLVVAGGASAAFSSA